MPRVDSALFTGRRELVWLPPETTAYTRSGDEAGVGAGGRTMRYSP